MFPWSRKPKDLPTNEKKIEDFGLYIHAGEQLAHRTQKQKELSALMAKPVEGETPYDRIRSLEKKIHDVNALVREASLPWLRAGTDQRYRRAVNGYEALYRMILRDCRLMLDELKGRDAVEQRDIAMHLEIWSGFVFFEQILFLTDVSFAEQDVGVTADRVLVIQQPAVPQQRESMTSEKDF